MIGVFSLKQLFTINIEFRLKRYFKFVSGTIGRQNSPFYQPNVPKTVTIISNKGVYTI